MPAFAHVLDAALGMDVNQAMPLAAGVQTMPLLARPMVEGWTARHVFEPAPPPPRPTRHLGARQRAALATLRTAGATDLRPDFLTSELKAAFRRLARRLHPDVHAPGASAEAFRQVYAAYRELLASEPGQVS